MFDKVIFFFFFFNRTVSEKDLSSFKARPVLNLFVTLINTATLPEWSVKECVWMFPTHTLQKNHLNIYHRIAVKGQPALYSARRFC